MTFFEKKYRTSMPPAAGFAPTGNGSTRGDRTITQRNAEKPVPEHRKYGIASKGRLERGVRGCLFEVAGTPGFFDLDGYWCVQKQGRHNVEISRGAPKAVMRLLTSAQKRDLERARLQARRHGVR